MPAATRRAVRNATNLLTATPDEAAIIIATALGSATDLLHLAAACRRFALKYIAARPPPPSGAAAAAAAAAAEQELEMWSIAEEAARRWIITCTNQERGWVPRRGRASWLGLMWELQVLRKAAVFGRSHEDNITLSEGGALATMGDGDRWSDRWYTAASKAVMRAGRHYAQFTVVRGMYITLGVIRPGCDVEGGEVAYAVDGHCFYDTYDGSRCPGYHSWEGMQGVLKRGDRIGMLLDLDQGTMTVYKNDERLGVMATGLSGEYSWAVTLATVGSLRIEPAAQPAE
jgi:hypothetical protein